MLFMGRMGVLLIGINDEVQVSYAVPLRDTGTVNFLFLPDFLSGRC